jgi:hypothetical protein
MMASRLVAWFLFHGLNGGSSRQARYPVCMVPAGVYDRIRTAEVAIGAALLLAPNRRKIFVQ